MTLIALIPIVNSEVSWAQRGQPAHNAQARSPWTKDETHEVGMGDAAIGPYNYNIRGAKHKILMVDKH